MGLPANFKVVNESPEVLMIRDLGPWDQHFTVTNDIEGVVARLRQSGKLENGQRLLYYDSDGELTEAVLKDGEFSHYQHRWDSEA